jgi:adenylate cyclase
VSTETQAERQLVLAALAGQSLPELLDTACRGLRQNDVPLTRAAAGTLLVHPVLDSTLAVWRLRQSPSVIDTPRPARRGSEPWRASPFYGLLVERSYAMRLRLPHPDQAKYPVLQDLAAEGATDYLALRTPVGPDARPGDRVDLFSSWVTDHENGFSEAALARIRQLEPFAALAFSTALARSTTRSLLATYLGSDAAGRVLGGAIERGSAQTIDAVIWYSDLEDFTRLSDGMAREQVLDLLNAYAELLADAIEAAGGEILKFMGDGILAIFRARRRQETCAAALSAWRSARRQCADLGRARSGQGSPISRPYLALHVGELLYGNIGGRSRLDFTVLGPAVNETVRIAALSRTLGQQVVMSETFAAASGCRDLVGLGRYALRGVTRPQMLFTLDPAAES